jgi:hypothetical protein
MLFVFEFPDGVVLAWFKSKQWALKEIPAACWYMVKLSLLMVAALALHAWKASKTSLSVASSHAASWGTVDPRMSSSETSLVSESMGMALILLHNMQNLSPESPFVEKLASWTIHPGATHPW